MEGNSFVFDKSSKKHGYYAEALDRLLRELYGIDENIGGKDFIMGGDYGQCLPIVEKTSHETQFRILIKNMNYGMSSRNTN